MVLDDNSFVIFHHVPFGNVVDINGKTSSCTLGNSIQRSGDRDPASATGTNILNFQNTHMMGRKISNGSFLHCDKWSSNRKSIEDIETRSRCFNIEMFQGHRDVSRKMQTHNVVIHQSSLCSPMIAQTFSVNSVGNILVKETFSRWSGTSFSPKRCTSFSRRRKKWNENVNKHFFLKWGAVGLLCRATQPVNQFFTRKKKRNENVNKHFFLIIQSKIHYGSWSVYFFICSI